jgi:patatin-like phospholipase/acyl hydrolase
MNNKYLLSLDGGGVRELATVTFLANLERELGEPLYKKFDFFIGTSAGAITAMALSIAKMNGDSLLELWSEKTFERILDSSLWDSKLGLMQINPKYDGKGKEQVLNEYFGNLKLGDASGDLAIVSYDIEERKPLLLTSYGNSNISAIDAGHASSAAPIYYPTARVGNRYLIDGGIVANNPVLHGYAEVKKLYPDSNVKILSVGTGLNKRPLKGKASQKWGLIGWLMHDLFGLMLESSLDHEIATEIIGKDYIRVNSPLGKVNRRLDDNNKRNLNNIRKMGETWWQEFGDSVLDLLS